MEARRVARLCLNVSLFNDRIRSDLKPKNFHCVPTHPESLIYDLREFFGKSDQVRENVKQPNLFLLHDQTLRNDVDQLSGS